MGLYKQYMGYYRGGFLFWLAASCIQSRSRVDGWIQTGDLMEGFRAGYWRRSVGSPKKCGVGVAFIFQTPLHLPPLFSVFHSSLCRPSLVPRTVPNYFFVPHPSGVLYWLLPFHGHCSMLPPKHQFGMFLMLL